MPAQRKRMRKKAYHQARQTKSAIIEKEEDRSLLDKALEALRDVNNESIPLEEVLLEFDEKKTQKEEEPKPTRRPSAPRARALKEVPVVDEKEAPIKRAVKKTGPRRPARPFKKK